MALMFTVGLLLASWLGMTVLAGIFFVAGCGLAARYARPADLLTVVLTPPVLFLGALLFVEAVTASGSLLLSVVAGSVVVLASLALWLLAGVLLTVVIAWPRGLPQCLRDFRRDLRTGPAGPQSPGSGAPRPPWSAGAARDPLTRPARAGGPRPSPREPGGSSGTGPAPRGPGRPKNAGPTSRTPDTKDTSQR